jgi:hypothetical protein
VTKKAGWGGWGEHPAFHFIVQTKSPIPLRTVSNPSTPT